MRVWIQYAVRRKARGAAEKAQSGGVILQRCAFRLKCLASIDLDFLAGATCTFLTELHALLLYTPTYFFSAAIHAAEGWRSWKLLYPPSLPLSSSMHLRQTCVWHILQWGQISMKQNTFVKVHMISLYWFPIMDFPATIFWIVYFFDSLTVKW